MRTKNYHKIMKKLIAILFFFFVLVIFSLSYMTVKKQKNTYTYYTMGTILSFDVIADEKIAVPAVSKAYSEIQRINDEFSNYSESSSVSILNNSGKKGHVVSNEFISILERSREMSQITNGLFDITVSPLVKIGGYRHKGRVPSDTEINFTMQL